MAGVRAFGRLLRARRRLRGWHQVRRPLGSPRAPRTARSTRAAASGRPKDQRSIIAPDRMAPIGLPRPGRRCRARSRGPARRGRTAVGRATLADEADGSMPSEPADRGLVAEDVAEEVLGHHDVEGGRVLDEQHGRGIDKTMLDHDLGNPGAARRRPCARGGGGRRWPCRRSSAAPDDLREPEREAHDAPDSPGVDQRIDRRPAIGCRPLL